MKRFLALPAFLRLVICAQPGFSVYSDLLAFPQYEVVFSHSYIPASQAHELLAQKRVSAIPPLQEDGAQHAFDTNGDLSLRREVDDDEAQRSTNDRNSYERLILNSRPYLCTIPYVPPPVSDNTTAAIKEEEQQELARATDHGLELLKDMQGSCIYYPAGWWVYSFCYNEGIRQFHPLPPGRAGVPPFPPIEDRNVQSYLLGQFPKVDRPAHKEHDGIDGSDSIAPTSALITHGESNYLTQRLEGGTVCDLTDKPRRIDIQYHCNPSANDRIAMIKETASCVYLMVIHTPRLCNDVVFQPPQLDKPNPITCQEIVSSAEEEEQWHRRVSAESDAYLRGVHTQQEDQQSARPLIIGGITVGGRQLAGASPETTVKASNIVLAGQRGQQLAPEKFIATLAKSDGKYTTTMSEPEMVKVGLKGTKDELEKWVKEMDELADGAAWKLDVVRTPAGMEFRGIFLDEEQEFDGKTERGETGSGEGEPEQTDDHSQAENKGYSVSYGDAAGDQRGHGEDGAEETGPTEGDEVGSEEEYK